MSTPSSANHVPVPSSSPDRLRYVADHSWAKLPGHVRFGYTHGVVEDAAGRIYIANQSEHAIAVFDADGRFITGWGKEYASGAHGLAIARDADGGEFLLLSNTSLGHVVKTTLDGRVIWTITAPTRPDIYGGDKKFVPTEAAVASNGNIYVADGYGQPYVHIFDRDGRYLSSFGGRGSEPGQLAEPHGIVIDARGGTESVVVANRANKRIDRFTLDGAFVRTIVTPADLRYPCTAVLSGERLFVPDLFGRLSVFDRDDRLIGHLGDYLDGRVWDKGWGHFHELDPGLKDYPNIAHANRRPGRFSSPHGMRVDRAGNIYVAEWINDGRVTKLTPVG